MKNYFFTNKIALLLFVNLILISPLFGQNNGFWNTEILFKTPNYRVIKQDSIRTIYYEGISFQGKRTEVYALYATPASIKGVLKSEKNLPAVVCVHGGGGTAIREWVSYWAKKGYAAIALDWRGNGPDGKHLLNGGPEHTTSSVPLHPNSKIEDSWTYQAVSQIVLAHSLIRSFSEIDSSKTVLTGISWGGFLSSIVSGVDQRFKAIIPVYGCGYIQDSQIWEPYLRMGKTEFNQWTKYFDPAVYLAKTKVPLLFINGTNDDWYPISIWQKSINTVESHNKVKQLLKLRMVHGHWDGWLPEEIYAFADSYTRNGKKLPEITRITEVQNNEAEITYFSEIPIVEVNLLYTNDSLNIWKKKKWLTKKIAFGKNKIKVELPHNCKAWCVQLKNRKQLSVTSKVFYDKDEYKLVWSDEFNYEGLPDSTKWDYEEGYVRNKEIQIYKKKDIENSFVSNGTLKISLRKSGNAKDSVTSAAIITKNKASWKYGKIEVLAKLPKGLGVWPAIWMMPEDDIYGHWPKSGEIDIMEYVGCQPDSIFTTIHCSWFNFKNNTLPSKATNIENLHSEFHLYSMEWTNESITFFIDRNKVFSFQKHSEHWKEWPFDQRFYLLLNVAFGGSWGGFKGVDTSVLPQSMEIDYVRVYQKN